VEDAGASLGIHDVFMGVIIVAIVGNAAEHSTAILMSLKNKLDIAVSIAFGSALQISLFVVPVILFASYAREEPMNLLFTPFEVFSIVSAVGLAWMVVQDGETNWLEGVMLVCFYLCLAIGFFYIPNDPSTSNGSSTNVTST